MCSKAALSRRIEQLYIDQVDGKENHWLSYDNLNIVVIID